MYGTVRGGYLPLRRTHTPLPVSYLSLLGWLFVVMIYILAYTSLHLLRPLGSSFSPMMCGLHVMTYATDPG